MKESPLTLQQEATPLSESTQGAIHKLSKWIFSKGQLFARGKILEIGNGDGCIAKYCMSEGLNVEVLLVNLEDKSFNTTYAHLLEAFDMIFVLNKNNLIENNNEVLANSSKLLKEGGHLLSLLPVTVALYQGLNQGLYDWKSYNWEHAKTKIGPYYDLVKMRYFMIGDNIQIGTQEKNPYHERVMMFANTESVDFNLTGLFILVVGKKR